MTDNKAKKAALLGSALGIYADPSLTAQPTPVLGDGHYFCSSLTNAKATRLLRLRKLSNCLRSQKQQRQSELKPKQSSSKRSFLTTECINLLRVTPRPPFLTSKRRLYYPPWSCSELMRSSARRTQHPRYLLPVAFQTEPGKWALGALPAPRKSSSQGGAPPQPGGRSFRNEEQPPDLPRNSGFNHTTQQDYTNTCSWDSVKAAKRAHGTRVLCFSPNDRMCSLRHRGHSCGANTRRSSYGPARSPTAAGGSGCPLSSELC